MFVMTRSLTTICLPRWNPESVLRHQFVQSLSVCCWYATAPADQPAGLWESRSINLKDWLLWIVKRSSNLHKRRVACIHTSLFSPVSCPEHQITVLSCPLAYHPDAEHPLSWNYTFHVIRRWRCGLCADVHVPPICLCPCRLHTTTSRTGLETSGK